jgi:hypothetical protein
LKSLPNNGILAKKALIPDGFLGSSKKTDDFCVVGSPELTVELPLINLLY